MTFEPNITFPHHKLDAYSVSLEALVLARNLAERIPRGYGKVADQLKRAALGTVLGIAEGANRRTNADKRHRFEIARGECGESAAVAEAAAVLGLVPHADAHELLVLFGRVGAMLTRLIGRYS